jgi:hypothetical protein
LNIWECQGYKVIPTNGVVKKNGENVMGAGLAKQASVLYPELAKKLCDAISLGGNHVYPFPEHELYSFPTKHHFSEMSDINLMIRSARQLKRLAQNHYSNSLGSIHIPKVGCGLGSLDWKVVKPLLERELHPYTELGVIKFVD